MYTCILCVMDYLSILCFLLALVAIHIVSSTYKGQKSKLPPGPYPLPIIGNLLSIGTKPHVSLAKLAKTYGPLMILHLGQVPTVIISSAIVAKEALQKNDISFSNRMVVEASRVLDHHEKSLAFLPSNNSRWRNLRKICKSQVFSTSRLDGSQILRRNKVKDLLSYVQKCCDAGISVDIGQAAFTTTLNLLSTTFFSMDLGDPNSEIAHEFRQLVAGVFKDLGETNLADYYPILKKLDLQGIKRRSQVSGFKMLGFFGNIVKQRLQSRTKPDSLPNNDLLDALLDLNQEKSEDQVDIPHLLADLFLGGTDTTSITMEWAMAELLNKPEKLKKAQAELEEIIGKGNPIEEADIAKLPYLQAIIKETFRLHPVVPFLLPRKVDSNVKLFGYTVPKNAQVLVNVWAIGRDPNSWENPFSFEPERFLDSKLDVKGHDFELIPFGAGRRMCPGFPLAIRMVHLVLGSLIHNFDWKLEDKISSKKMDMDDMFRFNLQKAQPLLVVPVRR